MALTRRFLKEVLADREDAAELIDQIIDAHAETVAGLKAELTKLQEENGGKTAEELHAELEQIKAGSEDGTTFKAQYDALKAEYNAFKTEHEKKQAYREKGVSLHAHSRGCDKAR